MRRGGANERRGLDVSSLAATLAVSLAATLRSLGAEPAVPRYATGFAFFQANCAVCHGAAGTGQPGLAPGLTSYPARYAATPEGRRQLALTVLYGMFGSVTVETSHYDFKMPDFARFDDDALATVLNFVVFDVAHAPAETAALTAREIAAERNRAIDGAEVRKRRAQVLAALGL